MKKAIIVEPSVGKLLISKPFLLDSYFKRSVILLGEHSDDGSVGFILNKPTDLLVSDALEDFPTLKLPLYFGGPIQTDTVHFLHTLGEKIEGAKKVLPGIYWGGDLAKMRFLVETQQIKPSEIRFFAGYSGWDSEQLEDEIRHHDWLVSQGKKEFALSTRPEDLWGTVLRAMGSNYAVMANFPDDPSLN